MPPEEMITDKAPKRHWTEYLDTTPKPPTATTTGNGTARTTSATPGTTKTRPPTNPAALTGRWEWAPSALEFALSA